MTGWTAGRAAALSAAFAAVLAAGCTAGSSGSSPAPTSSSPAATSSSPAPSTSTTTSTGAHSTLLFVFENHSRSQIMRDTCSTGTHKEPGALLDTCMPYLNSLGQQYGQDTAYENTGSPSLPNYLSFWGNSTFGVPDDHPPSYHPIAGDSVGDEALAAGKTVKAYEESMPSNCTMSAYKHLYFPKHNPWAYFNGTTQRRNCNTFDVPMGTTSSGAFASDIANGKLPTIGYAVGNVCDDGHNDNSTANPPNCYPRTVSDPWFKAWMTKIFAGPQWQAGNLTVIVTTDEADADGAGHNIPFVVIDKRLAGKQISFAANHYSLCKWLAQAAGVTPPHNAATASDLKAAFGL